MEQTIVSALLTLAPHQFSDLIQTLSSDLRIEHHRCCSLILSPRRFTHTLHLLNSLSLHQKTMLIARYLLTTLKQLTVVWDTQQQQRAPTSLRDSDAVLLLMLLCEVSHHEPAGSLESTPSTKWIDAIKRYTLNNTLTLTLSGIAACPDTVLCKCVDTVTRCWGFLNDTGRGSCGEREVGTSAVAIVSFPWVEVDGVECAICMEEMPKGRDVCELPCRHSFHWVCLLPWLHKRNTCPCCRFLLPTDDVFGEIQRLWEILANKGGSTNSVKF